MDYHLSARLRVPLGASTLVVVSGGPTYFDASQQFVTGIETAERGDPFNEVDVLSTTVEEVAVSAWGYHVGVDVAYFGLRDLGFLGQWSLLDHLGVGLKVRYSRGKPDIDLRGVRQERALQVGLAHIVGGLRIVF